MASRSVLILKFLNEHRCSESQPHLVFPADSLIGKQLTAKGYTTLTAKERSYISKSTDAELFASTINCALLSLHDH